MHTMPQSTVTLAEAQICWNQVIGTSSPATEYVPLAQAAGRITARPIRALQPYPPYRKSPFDGYALGAGSTGTMFAVVATVGAGQVYAKPVHPGEAVRLMTGCAVPGTCSSVVMQEQVEPLGPYIRIASLPDAGENIIPIGEECMAGTPVIDSGVALTGNQIAVAAGLGHAQLPVYQDIRVLLLTSGREITAPGKPLPAGHIYNSNALMLHRLLTEEGIRAITAYHMTDDPQSLPAEISRIRLLAQKADVILSTGGVSVGPFDTIPDVYASLGAKRLYTRIAMRPGSASYGGYIDRPGQMPLVILGLSGNPSAAFNAFHLIALPVLRALRGEKERTHPILSCRLTSDLPKENPVDRFIQGRITLQHGTPFFTPNHVVTSSALLGLAQTNGLAIRPKGSPPCTTGQKLSVMMLSSL